LHKLKYIVILALIVSGCSAGRIKRTEKSKPVIESRSYILLDDVRKQNITNQSFFIQKAEIEVIGQSGTENLLGSIKFVSPDEYLISIRSRTGIEAARIYINTDTVLINDRINRKLFCGSTYDLKSKYGVTTSVFPLIFGDYINTNFSPLNSFDCVEGKVNIESSIEGIRIRYAIDCNYEKSVLAIAENSLKDEGINIKYKEFIKKGGILIPADIEIVDFQRETTIKIKIQKLETPWEGIIEFVPGNRYEIKNLR